MADEISYAFNLSMRNGLLTDAYAVSGGTADQSSAFIYRNTQSFPHTGDNTVELGSISNAGWAVFANLDTTNFIQIGLRPSSTFYPFLELQAGDQVLCRLATNDIYAQADTATVKLLTIVYND